MYESTFVVRKYLYFRTTVNVYVYSSCTYLHAYHKISSFVRTVNRAVPSQDRRPPRMSSALEVAVTYALDLRCTSGSLQSSVDAALTFDSDHVRLFISQSYATDVVEYARLVSYTTHALFCFKAGQILCGSKPPAPQEEHLKSSSMCVLLDTVHASQSAHAVVASTAEGAAGMGVSRKQGQISELFSKWETGDPWPAGVPAPPLGWKPGDPLTANVRVVVDKLSDASVARHGDVSLSASLPLLPSNSQNSLVPSSKKIGEIPVPFVQLNLNPEMDDTVNDFGQSRDDFEESSEVESSDSGY